MIDGFDQMDIPCCCICLVIAMLVCRDWSEIKIEVHDFSSKFLIWEYYSEKTKSDIESDSEPEDKPRFNIWNLNNVIMDWFRRILDFSYFSAEILAVIRFVKICPVTNTICHQDILSPTCCVNPSSIKRVTGTEFNQFQWKESHIIISHWNGIKAEIINILNFIIECNNSNGSWNQFQTDFLILFMSRSFYFSNSCQRSPCFKW